MSKTKISLVELSELGISYNLTIQEVLSIWKGNENLIDFPTGSSFLDSLYLLGFKMSIIYLENDMLYPLK